jgi:hypothetical protein
MSVLQSGVGKAAEWVFCTPPQKWQKEMVTTYKKGKDISVMVWACIWWENERVHKSGLVIMERDPESKKNTKVLATRAYFHAG